MSTEIIPAETNDVSNPAAVLESFRAGTANVFSSFVGADFDTRSAVIRAMTNATPLNEYLNKSINLANFVAQVVEVNDQQTGQVREAVRVILVDDKGKAYAAVSDGVVRALQNITGVLGMPSEWPHAVKVRAEEQRSRAGFRYLTLIME